MRTYRSEGWDEPPRQTHRQPPPPPGWGQPPVKPKRAPWWHYALTAFLALLLGVAIGQGGSDPDPAEPAAAATPATPGSCLRALDLADAGQATPGSGEYGHVSNDCRSKVAAPSNGGAAEPPAEQPPAEPPAEPEPEPAAPASEVGLGQEAQDGQFTFVVHSIDCGAATIGDNQFLQTDAQGMFCLVKVTVRNHGTEAQSLTGGAQKLIDDQGRTFDHEDRAWAALDDTPLLEQINPGNQVEGTLVFDVPPDTQPTAVELHDSLFSGGVTVSLS